MELNTLLAFAALVVAAIAGAYFVFGGGGGGEVSTDRLAADTYSQLLRRAKARAERGRATFADRRTDVLGNMLRALKVTLERSDVGLTTGRFLLLFQAGYVVALFFILTGFPPASAVPLWVAAPAVYVLCIIAVVFYLRLREKKRLERFLAMLPDTLDFVVRGVRAGLPLTNQVQLIEESSNEPIKSIFAKVSQFIKLGLSVDEALRRVSAEVRVREFYLLVLATTVQRKAGGNLGDMLSTLSDTGRKRVETARKLHAQTSQVRSGAIVVGLLPVVLAGLLSIVNPGFISPLFTRSLGHLLLGIAAILYTLAFFSLRFLANRKF